MVDVAMGGVASHMEFVVCKVHDIPRPLAMGSRC